MIMGKCSLWLFSINLVVAFAANDGAFTLKNELSHESWGEVVEAGGMHVGSGRTKRFVELTDGQPNIPHQACILPDGKPGHCRHLHFCVMDEFKTDFLKFMDYLCIIKRSSIGTCCPDSLVESRVGGLAGDLPQTAGMEEEGESLQRITRAENRGCGVSTAARMRVVGARPADVREWPWMAAVMADGREQYCGGTLITDQHVLTAAHCTRRWKPADMTVRLGEYDFRRRNDTRSFDFRVIEKRQHVDFDLPSYHHDVSILKLHRPAVFNTYVWPICLPPVNMDFTNETAVVIGWGTQYYGGPASDILMEVSVPVWPHLKCVDAFTDSIFNESICAGGYEGGADSCQGDSGGPLMYRMSSGRWVIIGVVSWGIRCAEPGHPGIYAKVQDYLRWIVENSQF